MIIASEIYEDGVVNLCNQLSINNIDNVKIFKQSVLLLIDNMKSNITIDQIWILFPDPWPKDRHQKRRLFNNPIWIDQAVRTLESREGHMFVATDFTDYFVQIKHRLDDTSQLIYLPELSQDTNYIQTSFEIKYRTQGRQIYRAVYRMKNGI